MLEIQGLQKEYRNFRLNLSMQVKKGQITGLIGQNGAGKSTTFKAILGLIRYDKGSITVLGKDAKALTPQEKQQLGVVLSDSGFSGYLTVKDIAPILKGMYQTFDKEFFLMQAERFGLPMNKPLKDFSTGMKAKCKLLCAISHDARLLILDEPTAGLDVLARDELLLLLREFMEKDEENAVLISSHISSDLESLCDDLYFIHKGEIILHEETDRLLEQYALLKVDPAQYEALDQTYLTAVQQTEYGYLCLTNQKQFYKDNAPGIVIEKASIDGVISLMIKGEKR